MPARIQTPCTYPGCPNRAEKGGRCADHRPPKREYVRRNDDAFYHKPAWQKVRAMKIRRDPMCEACLEHGLLVPGEIVHHVVEIADDMSLALDMNNLQTLCRVCHARVHGYQANFRGADVKVTAIGGPPGAGKTTYVREQMKPGDVIIDIDLIWEAISGQEHHEKPAGLYRLVDKLYQTAIENISLLSDKDVWIVMNGATKEDRARYKKMPGCKVQLMLTRPDECMKRIEADETRKNKAMWRNYVYKWYARYEPE